MESRHKTVFRYYLYNNGSRSFAEIRDGTVCGRIEGEITYPKDDLISRKHCQFSVVGNEIYIEDFDSTNKTKVNTVPIQSRRKRRIRLNDVIEIGAQRFILTNQNRFAPSNIHDLARPNPVYKALRKDDGSLTQFVTGLITRNTLVRIDRPMYRKLAVRHRFRPVRENSSTILTSLGTILFWSLYFNYLSSEGAIGVGLPYSSDDILPRYFLIAMVSTIVLTGVHHYGIRRLPSLGLRRGALASCLLLMAGASWWGAARLELSGRIAANLNAYHCLGSAPAEQCRSLAGSGAHGTTAAGAAQPAAASAQAAKPELTVRGPASIVHKGRRKGRLHKD
jgi:hypothetical protein